MDLITSLHENEISNTETENYTQNFGVVSVTPEMYFPVLSHYFECDMFEEFEALLAQMQRFGVKENSDVFRLVKKYRKTVAKK